MMLLGSVAIGSVFALFDLSMLDKDKVFMYWMIFSGSFFSPIFALAHVPKKETFTQGDVLENKFFTFLIKYIGVPFIYIYFLILYAYSIKVLMHFSDWPKGQITWMVIAFSIFGYKMYIFTHRLREENALIKLFRRFFPWVVIPQLLMLFYAIYLRIHQYDITMNRYFVVVFGVWLLGISLYYALSKQKYLGIIPFSIGIIILLISVGPWSVYSLPATRQYDKLVSNLETAHILQGGTIVSLVKYSDIDEALSGEIYDGVDYMCDYSECARIKKLFAKELVQKEKQSREDFEKNKAESLKLPHDSSSAMYRNRDDVYSGLSKWEVVQAVSDTIKVKSNRYGSAVTQRYLNFHTNYDDEFFPIKLDSYGYMVNVYGKNNNQKSEELWIALDSQKKELTIYKKDAIVETIPSAQVLEKIMSQENGTDDITLPKESLIFELTGAKYDIKLFLKNINIPNPRYVKKDNETDNSYDYSAGYALVTEK